MAERDPFSQVHDWLAGLLWAHAPLAAIVRLSNRITFNGTNESPMKTTVASADLPELRLVPANGNGQLPIDSSTGCVTLGWQVQVATGDQRATEGALDENETERRKRVFPILFEAIRALHGWIAGFRSLTWNSRSFVVSVKLFPSVQIGVTQSDLNRNIKGWSLVCDVQVLMNFKTSDLLPVTS